jgi:predicted transcriptional regulator
VSRHLFLSVRPEFAAKILSGTKTVEFRRTRPRAAEGQPVVVYASSPVMAIVGIATIVRIDTASPSRLWDLFREPGGISRARYREYFRNAREAHAITLADAEPLLELVELTGIRDVIPGFQPPQAFNYMGMEHVLALGLPSSSTLL